MIAQIYHVNKHYHISGVVRFGPYGANCHFTNSAKVTRQKVILRNTRSVLHTPASRLFLMIRWAKAMRQAERLWRKLPQCSDPFHFSLSRLSFYSDSLQFIVDSSSIFTDDSFGCCVKPTWRGIFLSDSFDDEIRAVMMELVSDRLLHDS